MSSFDLIVIGGGSGGLSAAAGAAAKAAVDVADSDEGLARLANVRARIAQFRAGLERLGQESIPGDHPVVPLMVRDTEKTKLDVDIAGTYTSESPVLGQKNDFGGLRLAYGFEQPFQRHCILVGLPRGADPGPRADREVHLWHALQVPRRPMALW